MIACRSIFRLGSIRYWGYCSELCYLKKVHLISLKILFVPICRCMDAISISKLYSTETLLMLNVKRLRPLDVDEAAVGVGVDPQFFRPLLTQDQFLETRPLARVWPEDCECINDLSVSYVEPRNRLIWAKCIVRRALRLSAWGQTGSVY